MFAFFSGHNFIKIDEYQPFPFTINESAQSSEFENFVLVIAVDSIND
jgi:hypothetical protein